MGAFRKLVDFDPGEGFVRHFLVASMTCRTVFAWASGRTVSRLYSCIAMTVTTLRPCSQ